MSERSECRFEARGMLEEVKDMEGAEYAGKVIAAGLFEIAGAIWQLTEAVYALSERPRGGGDE